MRRAYRSFAVVCGATVVLAGGLLSGAGAKSVPTRGAPGAHWSGEFHPFRLPSPDLWRDVLQKMKASGFNTVSIYFDWGYHSPKQGVYDFTGVRDMDRLLDMAAGGRPLRHRPPRART